MRARAVYINWFRELEDGKIYDQFLYLLNNLIFSIFLKEESDWELMTSLSSELKNFKVLEKKKKKRVGTS